MAMVTKQKLIAAMGSVSSVARAAGVSRQAVWQWSEKVPVNSCRAIERNTSFTVHDLRPDVFGPAPGIPPEPPKPKEAA